MFVCDKLNDAHAYAIHSRPPWITNKLINLFFYLTRVVSLSTVAPSAAYSNFVRIFALFFHFSVQSRVFYLWQAEYFSFSMASFRPYQQHRGHNFSASPEGTQHSLYRYFWYAIKIVFCFTAKDCIHVFALTLRRKWWRGGGGGLWVELWAETFHRTTDDKSTDNVYAFVFCLDLPRHTNARAPGSLQKKNQRGTCFSFPSHV